MSESIKGRIMGMDMSLRSSGLAVIESAGSVLKTIEYLIVKNPPDKSVSDCLLRVFRGVLDVLERCRPQAAAIKEFFSAKISKPR